MPWIPVPKDVLVAPRATLGADQARVLGCVDGRADTTEIARRAGLTEHELDRILRELVAIGAIEAPADRVGDELEDGFVEIDLELDAPDDPEDDATHRALFERRLRDLPGDARAALAARAREPELSALCFDPLAAVARAVLANPSAGLVHARLVAQHHRTSAGLEAVGARASFAADEGVRRALLGNPALPASLFRRIWQGRRLAELHQIGVSHDVPEQTRRAARDLLRTRFATAPPEERVELIVRTEGRVLAMLSGLTLDARATALLCARPVTSAVLAQHIGRWHAAPPALVAHLLRSELVRRSKALRTLLERHPNAPRKP